MIEIAFTLLIFLLESMGPKESSTIENCDITGCLILILETIIFKSLPFICKSPGEDFLTLVNLFELQCIKYLNILFPKYKIF